MSAPSHDDDQLKLEIFDSFSKTVMRNASRNFAAAAKTRRKNGNRQPHPNVDSALKKR